MKESKQNFIRKIQIKNYKSIKDLTIEFHAGLNIIIGPNGTGKTNFVNAVNGVFTKDSNDCMPIGFEFNIEFMNEKDELMTYSGSVQKTTDWLKNRSYYSKATFGTDISTDDSLFGDNIFDFFFANNMYCEIKLLSFSHLVRLEYVNHFGTLKISIDESNNTTDLADYAGYEYFFIETIPLPSKITLETITKIVKIKPMLLKNLANLSPIKDCRIAYGYTFQRNDGVLQINRVLLEFFVNDEWISWNQLSDGTKRLFYIISATLNDNNPVGHWLLIESPELGIHPDALYKLMDFFKEQALDTQIIITTHSPDVLNLLESNELHKIVVTRIDKQQGTLMHHLSPQKVQKAQSYMEDLSLKDFWVHSNLEALDEA
jgi:AAA15 family ATPase/GTPase